MRLHLLTLLVMLVLRADVGLSTKRGLAAGASPLYSYCADLSLFLPAVSWTYSWGSSPPNTSCALINAPNSTLHFEPMIWGKAAVSSTPFTVSATHILGFNEPNGAQQSNLTPEEAASLWPKVADMAKTAGLKLVAPAPSGTDVDWLKSFFSACKCEDDIEVIAAHPYVCSASALKDFLDTWAQFKKPIWITEFNCGDGAKNASAAEHLAYMKEALPVLEGDSRVVRYSWMSMYDKKIPGSSLISGDALTPLGQFYATYA